MTITVFADSDAIISSFISKTGAAHILLNTENIDIFVSNVSLQEIVRVMDKLKLNRNKLNYFLAKNPGIVQLSVPVSRLKEKYRQYVVDPDDAHILAGAIAGKTRFLVTYNIRHFNVEKIKKDYAILVTTPANFLQYLRSLA